MPASWPDDLPPWPLLQGYQEQWGGNNVISTDMETGPPRRRRRSTAKVQPIQVSFDLTATQAATLRSFHSATLDDGTLPFLIDHPRANATIRALIDGPITIQPNGSGDAFVASFTLLWLP